MNLENGNWKFDETVVPVFDEHVKQSVPLYDEIHSLVTAISAWFLNDYTNMYDIGTSTGKVITSLIETYPKKNITFYGLDNSLEMFKKSSETFKTNQNIKVLNVDVTKNFIFENASLITSILTFQFIPVKDRQSVMNKVYDGLNKGAAFIMVEKVVGSNARFNEIWTELYHELKLKNGLSEEHVFAKARAIRGVMKPYTVTENIEMLEVAGFKDIDIFFKWNNFVGFIAIK